MDAHSDSVIATVPRISHFYGITISMYYRDHNPPHCHAAYGADLDPDVLYHGFTPAEMEGEAQGAISPQTKLPATTTTAEDG